MTSITDILADLYYNPATGFQGITNLLREARKVKSSITRKQVKDFLEAQETYQITKRPPKKKREKLPITAGLGTFQADLAFLPDYKKSNNGYSVLLTIVSVNTRKAYALPLKSKSGKQLKEAFTKLYPELYDETKEGDKIPLSILHTDDGTEFKNREMKAFYKDNFIQHRISKTEQHNHLGIIERFNRTLKALMFKYFKAKNTTKWVSVLPQFIRNYNNTYHSILKTSPNEVEAEEFFRDQFLKTLDILNEEKTEPELKVGDRVRILLPRQQFQKEGQTYSTEIYTISKVNRASVLLEDYQGRISKNKVQRITTRSSKTPKRNDAVNKAKKKSLATRRLQREEIDTLQDLTPLEAGLTQSGRLRRIPRPNPYFL